MENDIMNIMNDIKYGYLDINGNIHYVIDKDFESLYTLQSPGETLNNKVGVCWDQVELERYLFDKKNIKFNTYFIVYYSDNICPTHTFLIYKIDNDYYWFEHSWEKYRGIRKYSSENNALNDIKEKFINDELNNNYDDTNLFIFKYSKQRYGINLLEFYHHCENGEKVK